MRVYCQDAIGFSKSSGECARAFASFSIIRYTCASRSELEARCSNGTRNELEINKNKSWGEIRRRQKKNYSHFNEQIFLLFENVYYDILCMFFCAKKFKWVSLAFVHSVCAVFEWKTSWALASNEVILQFSFLKTKEKKSSFFRNFIVSPRTMNALWRREKLLV